MALKLHGALESPRQVVDPRSRHAEEDGDVVVDGAGHDAAVAIDDVPDPAQQL